MKYKKIFSKYKWIFLILLLSLIIRLFYFKNHQIWWDSAVYIEMGKYLFSFGKVGLWEASRPLVWPIILGFLWKLKLDPIFFGKILLLLFSLGTIWFTYLISKKVFNEKIALLSSLILTLSPTFFFFNSILLTAIPSTFFSLLGVYFFLNKKHFLSGLFLGLAFMTRFLQLGIIFCVLLIMLYKIFKKQVSFKTMFFFSSGFSIFVVPFLVFNFIRYSNFIYPFLLQAFMTQNTGWFNHHPFNFYFINIMKENILSVFVILGIIFAIKKADSEKTLLTVIVLLFFFYHSLIRQKEMRFIILFLPYLSILISYGLHNSYNALKKYLKIRYAKIVKAVFWLLFVFWLFQQSSQLFVYQSPAEFTIMHQYLNKESVNDGIWISNPGFLVYSNKKTDTLIYYPTFDSERAAYLQQNTDNAKHILLDTCDIPCPPIDKECEKEKKELIQNLKKEFNVYYNSTGVCEKYIFRSSS